MHRIVTLGPVLALVGLALGGLAFQAVAHEGTPPAAASGFVGGWRVTVTDPTGQTFPVLSTYGADGTTLHSGRASQPAAPGAPHAVDFNATGHGAWAPTGPTTAAVTFEVLNSDERGSFLGTLTISGVQRLGPDGDTFTGEYVITVRDPAGNVVAEIPTTAEGRRIVVEPAGRPRTPATPPGT